ncbi:MAG: adenylate cyclase, partial [Chloroflexota bacterium]|nr:adenylate cyclase [Chloroflexota bacterium]
MNELGTRTRRIESLVDAMDRPLLILALVTMVLYLIDLRGLIGWGRPAYAVLTVLIDFIFLFDLILKLRAFGAAYVQTPWFLIDFLSCLPVLDVVASGITSFRPIRFIRGFRILRILRGLRVLRALRSIPVFEHLMNEAPATESGRKFHRAMNLAMVLLTFVILGITVWVRKEKEGEYLRQVAAATRDDSSPAELE